MTSNPEAPLLDAADTGSLSDAAVDTLARQLTVDEILEQARRPEARASVCLRADLQAEYDDVLAELVTLVDAKGELVVDPEATIADQSKAGRAQVLSDRADKLRQAMQAAMWRPLFRGLSSEDVELFDKQYLPKAKKSGDEVDWNDYNNRLIAATAVDPEMTVGDVAALRKKLGSQAFAELIRTAKRVCVAGGVDVPKSPTFSLVRKDSTLES